LTDGPHEHTRLHNLIDPGRAERIAQSITDEVRKADALSEVAAAAAVTDSDRAQDQVSAGQKVATCAAEADVNRSSRVVLPIPGLKHQ
jgi:protein involved in sex pheromone biosynthesis